MLSGGGVAGDARRRERRRPCRTSAVFAVYRGTVRAYGVSCRIERMRGRTEESTETFLDTAFERPPDGVGARHAAPTSR